MLTVFAFDINSLFETNALKQRLTGQLLCEDRKHKLIYPEFQKSLDWYCSDFNPVERAYEVRGINRMLDAGSLR